MIRVGVVVRGIVQGVGFRPFVHGAAVRRGLAGWVRNRPEGVRIEVEGPERAVDDFLLALRHERPPAARVERIEVARLPAAAERGFRILESGTDAAVRPTLPADLAVCAACAAETDTPGTRRHRYPFTNCTRCGPRYTLVEDLPWDRVRTAMRRFPLCRDCGAEYADPADRRFHAEPIACPACGPTLRLLGPDGEERARDDAALEGAVAALAAGRILAVKGLGGFQLLVDATDDAGVARLRRRKHREEKPLAIMCPSLVGVRALCHTTPEEEDALAAPEAPILLVRRRAAGTRRRLADGVAPGSPHLGVMLPYTPLHRLLLAGAGRPLVCTSGNLSEEPMCVTEAEALARLGPVADLLLVHDRPIVRPVDDSVARLGPAGLEVLRRARGFAPLPLEVPELAGAPAILALGGHLKSTIALARDGQVVVSQHLGDLHTPEGVALLERTVDDLVRFLRVAPALVACDLHPDYASTRLAERLAAAWHVPLVRVQHHHAHVAAAIAEHRLAGPVLGFAWDGAGLGPDGVLWGGEALLVDGAGCRRLARLRDFALPGGERAMREPRRAALGILHALLGGDARRHASAGFAAAELRVLLGMLATGVQAPRTTSVGRLFDAVAALAGIREVATFEGQAAMELEAAAEASDGAGAYPLPLGAGEPAVADWGPLVRALLRDRRRGVPAPVVAARFHGALVRLICAVALRSRVRTVVLSGGCFQNARLARGAAAGLAAHGFTVHVPRRFPPNDGGLALGQVLVAARRAKEGSDVPRHSG